MTPIQVVGIGLDGAAGLTNSVRRLVEQATLLVGSSRHLSYFPDHPAERLEVSNFPAGIQMIQRYLADPPAISGQPPLVVVLTSGDPLFYGLGRLLLTELPPEQLTFHPHASAIQLAFSRIKAPWQDARVISAHGRSLDELAQALQQRLEKIAVLTDPHNTPARIADLLLELGVSEDYQLWVCENLGGPEERVCLFTPESLPQQPFAALNVVVLLRLPNTSRQPLDLAALPALGLPDQSFLSFADRPGLMTKREVRLLVLGELALQPHQVIWDIGAGTGSVSIEIARLFPSSRVYAIEQTAAGYSLIQQNSQRFQVQTITALHLSAPSGLDALPDPDRIFIGGSGGNLSQILDVCRQRLRDGGGIVLALATLEHLAAAQQWVEAQPTRQWQQRWLQVQVARSLPVGALTRFSPLNPVTLLTLTKLDPELKSPEQ